MDSSLEYFDDYEHPDVRFTGAVFKKEVLIMTRYYLVFLMCLLVASAADAADDWTQQSLSSSPSARRSHAMAYLGGDQAVLFGGFDASAQDAETWVYDLSDNTWTQQSPTSSPSARYAHAMAHIGGDQVLLFGGYDASGNDDETWVYDLSANTWTQQSPTSSPSARNAHAMAHIGGDQVLLFGGYDGAYDDETWVYDLSANTWTQQSPPSNPSARGSHAMAYIGGDQVVLFGGQDGSGYDDETWVYDLSADDWTQDTNTTQPSARGEYDLSETSMDGSSYPVLFGGWDGNYDDETWTFGGGDYLFPFEAMVLDIELISANTARVSWSVITGATDYDLYRRSTAFFSGSDPPWQTVTAPTTQLDFSDGIGNTNTNYYFLGKARSATQTSPASNIVGEFDFDADIP